MGKKVLTDTQKDTTRNSRRILLVANGQPPSAKLLAALTDLCGDIYAVDGGANFAHKMKLSIREIFGDFDSVRKATKAVADAQTIWTETLDQEFSDLDKALDVLTARGVELISVVGAFGKRLDHTFANLGLLLKHSVKASITCHGASEDAFVVRTAWQADLPAGLVFSILPMYGPSRIITKGLLYPLNDETLEMGVRDGVSNETLGGVCGFSCSSPVLAVIKRFNPSRPLLMDGESV